VGNDYPSLSDKAIKVQIYFVTMYLCEMGFSAVAVMKTEYPSRLIMEKELLAAI